MPDGPPPPSSPPPPPSQPPPPPPPPPSGDGWPAGPAEAPTGEDRARSPWVLVVAIVAGVLAVIVLPIVAAITIPAFLNQRERAWQAELASAVRNAAIEVEVAATQAGGRYDAIQGFVPLVSAELRHSSEAVELDTTSTLTGVHPGGFAICAEHRELDGSIAYVSDQGGLQEYRDTPCP